jgi:hypothetical protein
VNSNVCRTLWLVDGELSRERILEAFACLSEFLARRGIRGELCLLGGTVMVLAFHSRASTKDVDAIFQPAAAIREAASAVAETLELPEHWLNDAAKGYVSARHEVQPGDLPQFENLSLTAPTPEYMFAMKCLASRLPGRPGEKGDEQDIRFLAKHLGLRSAGDALDLVIRYYPAQLIPPRTQFLLEDIFSERGEG